MALSPDGERAMAYWGIIERAAAERATTASLWASLRDAAAELGLPGPGVNLRGVNEVRAEATRIQARSRELARLERDQALSERHVSQTPWSRSIQEQNALGIYHVRYEHTFIKDGQQVTEWRTSVITSGLPQTYGDLEDIVNEDAEELSDKYAVEHVGVGSFQLLAV